MVFASLTQTIGPKGIARVARLLRIAGKPPIATRETDRAPGGNQRERHKQSSRGPQASQRDLQGMGKNLIRPLKSLIMPEPIIAL